MKRLHSKLRNFCCALILVLTGLFLATSHLTHGNFVFAEDESSEVDPHFVTIYDDGSYLTVKTSASSVKDVLERAGVELTDADIVEPALETEMGDADYNINIYRARPALIIDGVKRHYIMTASYDPKQVLSEAGVTIYDGDEINVKMNESFLEAGAVSTYEIERNGGRTITEEETIAYSTEKRYDYNLAKGEQQLEQAGEDGRMVRVYNVEFKDNVEVSRTLVSEEVKREPVTEIIVVGAKSSISPERQECAEWAREAGVSEADLSVAIELIYHESGCRVDAANASGAYGIPQAKPGNKMSAMGDDWETNPVTQIRWMIDYVNGRYGGWQSAMNWWWEHHWY